VPGVGADWAEAFHDVPLGRPGEGVIEQFRVGHGPAGVARLAARCLEPDPAEVPVVLETRHGPLAEALADAGFTVLPVNPGLAARRRGPAKKKDDAEDARICCLLALDACLDLRKLIPHGPAGTGLRAIARDDERAARDERRIGSRLRAGLRAVLPAAAGIAGGGPGAAVFPRPPERWPSAGAPAAVPAGELEAFARSARHGWPGQVAAAMAAARLAVHPELARASAGTIRPAVTRLLAIRAQRRARQNRTGELLPGAPRTGRDHTAKDPDPGKAFPGGEIHLSMPGLGDRLAARAAGQAGGHHEQFTTPNAPRCYPGRAPVTRRPGRSAFTIARRLARNRHRGEAIHQRAFRSPGQSAWAPQFYDSKIAAGNSHHAALRKLGNRWPEVPRHRLDKGVCHDETTHAANRLRSQPRQSAA
jgi:Transposase